jgi:ribonuclease BN (tRNA processing enzyme)
VFAWKYGQLAPRSAPIDIIGPVGTRALLERLATAYGEWLLTPGFPVNVREITPGETISLSDTVRLSALKVPHTEESVAYCIERGGRRIVYTGDSGADDALADWARGCDLLVCECSLPASMAIKEHLTPEQCAALAARAQPKHVVLTHFYPPVERLDILATMRTQYSGYVTLARDGWRIELDDSLTPNT